MGSSTNIIEASLQALVDSLELPLARKGSGHRAREPETDGAMRDA